jgi:hypothetical protein
MASRRHNLSLTSALVTLLLELLDEAWGNLLLDNRHSLPIALGTSLDIIWVVSSTASAMRADDIAIVGDVKGLADVQLFKG